MTAFLTSLAGTAVKFIFLGAVAFAGIVCGKKMKDKRNNSNQEA